MTKIEMYQDHGEGWRWRLRASNGRIVADSAEGYVTKPGVRRAIANFVKYLAEPDVPVVFVFVSDPVVKEVKAKVRVSRPKAEARVSGLKGRVARFNS